jgi:broad specificity phosphatase PhoE
MPQVDVDTPPHTWRLGPAGVAGASALAPHIARYAPSRVVASLEPKATETGSIIAERLHVPFTTAEGLHEHDRRAIRFLGADDFAARMRDLFAQPDSAVFGSESARAALTRFTAAVGRIASDESDDVVIVSHGTVISLYVGARADVSAAELWTTLGFPSYVTLELPSHRIIEIVAAV